MKLIILTAAFLLCSTRAFALERLDSDASANRPTQIAQDVDLSELMSKCFLAYGTKELLARLDQQFTMSGQQKVFAEDDQTESLDYELSRLGDKLLIKAKPEGSDSVNGQRVTVIDGQSDWQGQDNAASDIEQSQTRMLAGQASHQPSVLSHYLDRGYTFEFLGRTQYKQNPVYAIQVTRGNQPTSTVFLDPKNYLVIAIMYLSTGSSPDKAATVVNEFSEYRPAAGTLFAFKQLQFVNGKARSELTVNNVDLDKAVDEDQFKGPNLDKQVRIAKPVVLPFDYSHQEIMVSVRLNGSDPLDFLFDTGASDIIIDRRTAAEQYLDKQGNFRIAAASGAVSSQTSMIDKLELGNLQLNGVQALILDLSPQSRQLGRHVAGIIGTSILSKFVFTIDFGKRLIIIGDPATYKAPETANVVPFVVGASGPIVQAVLNGKDRQSFLIDTGAAFNHLNAGQARKYFSGQPQHLTEGTGLDGRPVHLAMLILNTVALGSQTVSGVNFTYPISQNPTEAKNNGLLQTSNNGILGNPFWQNFTMTLDYKSQRLILQANKIVKARQEITLALTAGDTASIIQRDYRLAEIDYQKALALAQSSGDEKDQALALGRLGNLRRIMSRDLKRPEQIKVAFDYFSRAQTLARKIQDPDIEAHIIADWSLLYSDNGQLLEARDAINSALTMAPQEPEVNIDFAVHLYRDQLYSEMQKYVDKVLFLEPNNWQALWYQVKLSEMFNDSQKLKATLLEILRAYPASKLARGKLDALAAPRAPAQSDRASSWPLH